MHKQRLYLDDYVYDYLTTFGNIDTVVNHCIQQAMENADWWLQNEVNERRGPQCKQVTVYIDNPAYDEYREECGIHSQYCSVRRLLYYITMYELLSDIEPSKVSAKQYRDADQRGLVQLTTTYCELVELTNHWHNRCTDELLDICGQLHEVVDELTLQLCSE